jgi:putative ABC transport system permease protein
MVRPQVYVPFQLAPRPVSFVLRATTPLANLAAPIREQVSKLNKNAPVARLIALSELVNQAHAQNRFVAFLAGALAGIALVLACVGIAGVTSYSIAQRTNEIGVRMALGATPKEILDMIFANNIGPILAGLLAGLALSFALTPLLQVLLFGVEPGDPITFGLVSVFLLLVGALACYIPARRAMCVDPIVALRYE